MNRNDEFMDLKQELNQTPLQLEYTVLKAVRRAKKQKRRSVLWRAPVISFCFILILFVLLVNQFPNVAMAMSNVPVLKDLVAAVALDPSLKAAVENDYYQTIGVKQTQENVTVSVDYMVLDGGHISLFFHVNAPVDAGIFSFEVFGVNGHPINAPLRFDSVYNTGKLEEIQLEFLQSSSRVPKKMTFNILVTVAEKFTGSIIVENSEIQEGYDAIQGTRDKLGGKDFAFSFDLYPDKVLANTMKSIIIRDWITISEQRIYFASLNVMPTKSRLNIDCSDSNTAILKDLGIYFEDEKGTIYEPRKSGLIFPDPSGSDDIDKLYFESSYFSKAKELTMFVTSMRLIERSKRCGQIDLTNKTISNLPEGVTVDQMEFVDNTLSFTLNVKDSELDYMYDILSVQHRDTDGKLYYYPCSSQSSYNDGYQSSSYKIKDYNDNDYVIEWNYAPNQKLEEPIAVKMK